MSNEGSRPPDLPNLHLSQVETPIGIIQRDRVLRNLERTARFAEAHGLAWRPHVKTHKSRELGHLQLRAGAVGFTVATLHEGEVMRELTDDLLLMHPPFGEAKLRRLAALAARSRLAVALDSREGLLGVAKAGVEAGRPIRLLVEVDVGMHRVGLPDPDDVVRLAGMAAEIEGVTYGGVAFYPGHIRSPVAEQDDALGKLSTRLATVLEALDRAGLAPETVSGGSTPTLWRSHEVSGVTEIRPGTSIFHDRDMVSLGVCTPDEVAYQVLATVVSTAVPGQAVVDAGSKALSREEFRGGGEGYGYVIDHPEVLVSRLSEEHGILDLGASSWRPSVGDRVRIVPNHVCVSVNLQDHLLMEEEEGVRSVALEGRGRGV